MAESADYTRRTFLGGATTARITGGLAAGVTGAVACDDLSTWVGATANGPTRVMVNRLGATPEEIEISGVSGNNITIAARGLRGTSDTTHDTNATIDIIGSPRDLDEANYTVTETVGKATAANQLLVSDGANSFAALSVGASRIVGRKAAGDVDDMTTAELAALFGTADGTKFLADDGTLKTLGDLLGVEFARKSANETVTTSTTLQDDDHLTVSVGANQTWTFDAMLMISGVAAAGDFKFAFAVPAGAAGALSAIGPILTASTTDGDARFRAEGSLTTTMSFGAYVGDRMPVMVKGIIRTAGTAGSLTLQWAQNTSDANATTLHSDSYLEARRVA